MLFCISRQRKIIANRNLNISFPSEYLSMNEEKVCLIDQKSLNIALGGDKIQYHKTY